HVTAGAVGEHVTKIHSALVVLDNAMIDIAELRESRYGPSTATAVLAQLRRFEHFKVPKWLRLLRPTPKGRHYSGIGGTGPAVILGGGWAGSSSLSFFSNRLSSGSGSV